MLTTYIQKGEAIITYSAIPFDVRISAAREQFVQTESTVIYTKEKILVDDVRDFVYEMQKESQGNIKIGILVCDDIAVAAQHALLKVLEDMTSDTCILIYTHVHAVFLSTVLSRVIVKHEEGKHHVPTLAFAGKTVAQRFDIIKALLKKVEDEEVSKQDITSMVEKLKEHDTKNTHNDVYVQALSMLQQPSVSIKYVLEYLAMRV